MVKIIAGQTTSVLNQIHQNTDYSFKVRLRMQGLHDGTTEVYNSTQGMIYFLKKPLLVIAPACDGLELMVLFIGFIVCFPSSFWRKVWVIPVGLVVIHLVNLVRCIALVKMINSPLRPFFNFAHHYLFTTFIYVFIFLMWVWFVRVSSPKTISHAAH